MKNEKLRYVVGYFTIGITLWVVLSALFAVANYNKPDFPRETYSVYYMFLVSLHGLMVTAILSPLIILYSYWLARKQLSSPKVVRRVIGVMALYYVVDLSAEYSIYHYYYDFPHQEAIDRIDLIGLVWIIFMLLTYVAAGYGYGLIQRNREGKQSEAILTKQLAKLEADLMTEQNKHIRQRLGSHFVLNALSNIIALVRKKDITEAIEALFLLSGILREIAHTDDDTLCSLQSEIEFLEAYLAFQKIRFPSLEISWTVSDEARATMVPKHILQPLVENAFKHGMQADGQLMLTVEAYLENGSMNVQVRNSLSPQKQAVPGGEGQALTALRLEKAYNRPDLFKCSIVDNEYIADLVIPGEGKQ